MVCERRADQADFEVPHGRPLADRLQAQAKRNGFADRQTTRTGWRDVRQRLPFFRRLDSFVGAIDLLETGKNPLFVSHYRDASTKSQEICASRLGKVYGDFHLRHVRANVSFDKNDIPGLGTETTTRGRSFIFFALANLAASALAGITPIYIPENGLISLNVPLDPLRLGAWSTRTTHPFYMARWQDLLDNLGLSARLQNPYRFKTKGEMLSGCRNKAFLRKNVDITISCSSITKGRWNKA